jgi:hypothetical protein
MTFEYNYLKFVAEQHFFLGAAAFITRRALELEPGRDPRYKYMAELDYLLRLSVHGQFARIPHILAAWRLHEGNASRLRDEQLPQERLRAAKEFFAHADLPTEISKLRRLGLSNAYTAVGFMYQTRVKNYVKARYFYLRSLLTYPYYKPFYVSGYSRSNIRMITTLLGKCELEDFLIRLRGWTRYRILQPLRRHLNKLV